MHTLTLSLLLLACAPKPAPPVEEPMLEQPPLELPDPTEEPGPGGEKPRP